MSQQANTIYRKDYKGPGVIVNSINLCFELFDDHALVHNTMVVKNLDSGTSLFLHGEELELVSLLENGNPIAKERYQISSEGMSILQVGAMTTLDITTKIYPQNNSQLSGLYRSHELFCTQCEAEGFRRITYFFDRPDVLTCFTTKIIADKQRYPVLLSNGNLIESGMLGDGRHWVTWQDPFKKPSYLFALVAGDLAVIEDTFTTKSNRQVDLKIYVEKGNQEKCAHAMGSLKKAMAWDEQVYGLEYDLDTYMIVAVSDFNMGAMENKGLNIFNAKYVLADPASATDEDYAGIEGVIAHEYFHNWTGNRVTCRDWFQLSLKEGLTVFRDQEFSRDMNSRDVNRIKDVNMLRNYQFPEDAGPMAHPVRPDSYMEINNFYTATIYNKGAEVIRMQHTLLGENGFRKGMDLYFERHDGQAVTIDDFVSAMEDANHVDFTQLKRWYAQAGTPEVRARVTFDNDSMILNLTQYCKPTPGQEEKLPFYIPIKLAVFHPDGERYDLGTELIVLKEEKEEFVFHGVGKDAVVSLLRGFSAPIKLHLKQDEQALKTIILHESDGFSRVEAMQKIQREYLQGHIAKGSELPESANVKNMAMLFQTLLEQTSTDEALLAELLQPLSFEAFIQDMDAIDVQRVLAIKAEYQQALASHCRTAFEASYQLLKDKTENKGIEASAFGERKLKNILLAYLSKLPDSATLLEGQFYQAQTMTDEIAAFKLLADRGDALAEKAIDHFYKKWAKDELVLDKWFAAQAMADHPGVLVNVKQLMTHPAFHLNNPNKVRALIGSFAMHNPNHFHTEAGYQFLVSVILKLDPINPQTTARLVTPLTQWRRYHPRYQALMKQALEQILTKPNLSKDTYEVVSKTLN